MLRNVLDDPVGHEVPHRMTSADAIAAVRRRDGQCGDFELAHVISRQAVRAQNVPGSGDGYEMSEVPQLIMVPPTENLRYGVCAGDEEELSAGTRRLQIAEGVDRVGRTVAVDVDAADGEMGIGCRR